ncbi:MAG: 3-phosphoserine/phosphohydroxythreonine transaminase [Methyloversatilis sp.]|nr:3-phosphoserine/phosphohydroxythreonine transaminase [Methyloversatilis sp.]
MHVAARIGSPVGPAGRFGFSASAGPQPAEVVERITDACRVPHRSILALPFTSPEYRAIQAGVDRLLRQLLAVPDDFDILFMGCGASAHFALVPLNLLGGRERALHVLSGHWSRRAIVEARRYCNVSVLSAAEAIVAAPAPDGAAYCHYTSNETADGLQFHRLPATPLPLVADMTSDLLTATPDWKRFGLVYAGAQKTLGVAGLSIVIVRRDLLGPPHPLTPRVMAYAALSAAASRLCTPPVFAMFAALCMLEWMAGEGGVGSMQARLARRAAAVYAVIDRHPGFYRPRVDVAWRSRVTPCFDLPDAARTARFIAAAQAAGLYDLAGHPDVGGVRVSLYNGLSDDAVDALAAFMHDYAQRGGLA